MKAAGALMFMILPIAAAAQDKVQFEIDNLIPFNQKILQGQLNEVDGVAECLVNGGQVTLAMKPNGRIKLSAILKIVNGLKPFSTEKIAFKWESVKLAGKVILSFSVDKNKDKIQDALAAVENIEKAERKGDDYHLTLKSEVALNDVTAAVAKATENAGSSTTLMAKVVKDVVWIGSPKAAAAKDVPKSPSGELKAPSGSGSC